MKRIGLVLLIVVIFLISSKVANAQTGPCSVDIGLQCNAVNASCPAPLVLNRSGCGDTSIPDCTDREWFCENPSDSCTYNSAYGACISRPCSPGEINAYDCSQHNGDPTACQSSGALVCNKPDRLCLWKGAVSCEPINACTTPGYVTNPAVSGVCHAQTNLEDCHKVKKSNFGSDVCIEPDGWFCLPNSGTAHNCAYCMGSDCDDKNVIPYHQCQNCNRTGQLLYCDEDGHPSKILNRDWIRFNTAIGCIPLTAKDSDEVNVNYVIEFFLEFGTGMAGGVALFLIIVGSMQIMTSAGDPQRVQAGKELIAAAISGLLLLIFGVYILRIIGVNILGIPGL